MELMAGHHHFDEFADPAGATAAAFADVLRSSTRAPDWPGRAKGAARIERLIQSGARIDAALALIALELPQWQLRRIVYDGGEWHCALSRNRELADWLDQSAEGRHTDLALALLGAVVEAQQITTSSCRPGSPPQLNNSTYIPLCCDNLS